MSRVEEVDVVVVGSGPCGASTALHLVAADPRWAGRMVVLEKGAHPREKLCGGGITPLADSVLRGLALGGDGEPPHVRAPTIELRFPGVTRVIRGDPALRIVHRAAFDAWLVRAAERRGVRVRQEEPVVDVAVLGGRVVVRTSRATLSAKVVVAADGARSRVRRVLGLGEGEGGPRLAR